MWFLFRAKHKKLVLRCYPNSKRSGAQPNSSPLSYLCYYAATNSVKLRKVMLYIEKRAKHYLHRRKDTELLVTLKICEELTGKCKDNINIIAPNLVSIMLFTSVHKSIDVVTACVDCFAQYCECTDDNGASFDNDFYIALTELVQSFQCLSITNSYPDPIVARYVCLRAFYALTASSLLASTVQLGNKSHMVMHAILTSCWSESPSESKTFVNLLENLKLDNDTKPSARHSNVFIPEHEEAGDTAQMAVWRLGIHVLFNVFSLSDSVFLAECTKSLIHFLATKKDVKESQEWMQAVLLRVVYWTPVQLRHIILTCCLQCLNSQRIEHSESNTVVPAMVYTILNSKNTMSSISIIDVLRHLETHMYVSVEANTASDLEWYIRSLTPETGFPRRLYLLVYCASSLAKHEYYGEQLADIWTDIDVSAPYTAPCPHQIVVLSVLQLVTKMSAAKTSSPTKLSAARENVILRAWMSSAARLHETPYLHVRVKCAEVLYYFLNNFIQPVNVDVKQLQNSHTESPYTVVCKFLFSMCDHIQQWLAKAECAGEYYTMHRLLSKLLELFGSIAAIAMLPALFQGCQAAKFRYAAASLTTSILSLMSERFEIQELKTLMGAWIEELKTSSNFLTCSKVPSADHFWSQLDIGSVQDESLQPFTLDNTISILTGRRPDIFPDFTVEWMRKRSNSRTHILRNSEQPAAPIRRSHSLMSTVSNITALTVPRTNRTHVSQHTEGSRSETLRKPVRLLRRSSIANSSIPAVQNLQELLASHSQHKNTTSVASMSPKTTIPRPIICRQSPSPTLEPSKSPSLSVDLLVPRHCGSPLYSPVSEPPYESV
ncbi:hypothetical protein SJAG_04930 [Schizosaccharomyces japonicus yFS275]|uniref:Uncharacterized protein n=1 Tax=Schizosaccharomyces japonicus (strain yFS275 / FY16936) TaxID=402676 RepID=B6K853_SCHJY|nr:hypothetical protein SJAG_04930 [Schizosaccharomyces japonicus yFS275]EEB09707.1 hypothetical protein SJAG_04930 [Schizosaccharomyces japonicus yFS275]